MIEEGLSATKFSQTPLLPFVGAHLRVRPQGGTHFPPKLVGRASVPATVT